MAIPLISFKANDSGIGELAKSPDMEAEIQRRCQLVQRRARQIAGGDPHDFIVATAVIGRRRIHGSVMWRGGMRKQLATGALTAALEAARD